MTTRRTTRAGKTRRPADQGRRRLAPPRRGDLRQGVRSAHHPAHLELRAALPGEDLHLGRGRAGLHADAARDPADHPLRHRQRHDRRPARSLGAGLGGRRLRRGDPGQLRRQLRAGNRRRQGRRTRAFDHAPRHVRASAAGLASLHGQDRGRPADVAPAGRRQLDAGIPRDLGHLGRRHRAAVRHRRRAAVARLQARPADAVDHAGPVHRAPVLAAARQGRLHGRARDQLDRQRRAGRGHQRRAHRAEPGAPARQFRALRRQGAGQSAGAPDRRRNMRRSWCRSSTR